MRDTPLLATIARKTGLFALLGAVPVALVLLVLSVAGAQTPTAISTPTAMPQTAVGQGTPSPEATVSPNVKTAVRLEVDNPGKEIPQGQEFPVRVMVDSVEHLAGFAVTIGYDPKHLEPVLTQAGVTTQGGTPVGSTPVSSQPKTSSLGQFLGSSGRQSDVICDARSLTGNRITLLCNLVGPPVCQGGAPGASGSGLLGTVYFTGRSGGTTTLKVADSGLALDDVPAPCQDIQIQAIPHRRIDATVKVASGGSSALLLIGVVVGVVVVVALAGSGGYLWYRRRQTSGTSS